MWRAHMDKTADTPVPAELRASSLVPPIKLGDAIEEPFKEIASASNLEERMENWGSD